MMTIIGKIFFQCRLVKKPVRIKHFSKRFRHVIYNLKGYTCELRWASRLFKIYYTNVFVFLTLHRNTEVIWRKSKLVDLAYHKAVFHKCFTVPYPFRHSISNYIRTVNGQKMQCETMDTSRPKRAPSWLRSGRGGALSAAFQFGKLADWRLANHFNHYCWLQ